MNRYLQQGRTGVVAFIVAVLIALQTLVASYASAADSAMPMVDAFGNPLCISGMAEHEPSSPSDKGRTHLPQCCTLACYMAVGLAPPDRSVSVYFNPFTQPSDWIADAHAGIVRPFREDLPGRPRGPPQTA